MKIEEGRIMFAITVLLILGSLVGAAHYGYNSGVEERQVTVKVAAYPSETTNASTDDVTKYDNLKPHEQELFMRAVEEADGAFEEADKTMDADDDKQFFTDTKVVSYGGAYYPVFIVHDEVYNTSTENAVFLSLGTLLSQAFLVYVWAAIGAGIEMALKKVGLIRHS